MSPSSPFPMDFGGGGYKAWRKETGAGVRGRAKHIPRGSESVRACEAEREESLPLA